MVRLLPAHALASLAPGVTPSRAHGFSSTWRCTSPPRNVIAAVWVPGASPRGRLQ